MYVVTYTFQRKHVCTSENKNNSVFHQLFHMKQLNNRPSKLKLTMGNVV